MKTRPGCDFGAIVAGLRGSLKRGFEMQVLFYTLHELLQRLHRAPSESGRRLRHEQRIVDGFLGRFLHGLEQGRHALVGQELARGRGR